MKKPQFRKYNLIYALITGVIGTILFGLTISGQADVYLQYLEYLPNIDLGLLQKTTADEIINAEITQNITNISLPQAGDYRVISPSRGLYATNLSVHSKATAEEIPLIIADQRKSAPFDTDLLQGRLLFEFQADAPGIYELHVQNINLGEDTLTITIVPTYKAQNRKRILIGATLLVALLIGAWVIPLRPTLSKKKRQKKQSKWDAFIEED